MPESIARLLLGAITLYLGIGLLVALAVAGTLYRRLGPAAARGTPGFRMLIIPGVALLWPLVLSRMQRPSP